LDKLNIAIVANSIPESETMAGGYRIAIECAKRWLEWGHIISFFTNSLGEEMISRYIPRQGLDLNITPTPRGLGSRPFKSLAAAVPFYMRMTYRGLTTAHHTSIPEPMAIYSVSPFWPDIFPGFALRRRFARSCWLVAMSMYAPPPLKGWRAHGEEKSYLPEARALALDLNQAVAYPLIKRWADGVYVNNELDRYRAIHDGFSPDRVGVIGMGVDNNQARLVPEPPGVEYDAVFIGRLHPQKGVLELIDIWRAYNDIRPGARLAIIGNGPLEGKLRAKIERCGLRKQVDMLGFLDGKEKVSVFKSSRIAVHPSLYDSGGMAALEAMNCGLPGVSFDLPDLAVYYPQGMLKTPCYDLEAFARNIERLIRDVALYSELQAEALDWARQWDWDSVAERLIGLLRHLCRSKT
jgi:glycosyltransferase involved in cell wall biosynthesis